MLCFEGPRQTWTDRRTDDLIPSELSTLRVRMRIMHLIYLLYLIKSTRESRRPPGQLKGGVWGVEPPWKKK